MRANDVGPHEGVGRNDRAVNMAFRSEMHDRGWVVLFQQLPNEAAVPDIAVNKFIPLIGSNALQVVQVPRVRQLIQIEKREE